MAGYARSARRFLGSLPEGGGEGILARVTADAVRAFFLAESGRRGSGSLHNDVTAVRSLLRFLHLRGIVPDSVDGAVPAAADWHRPPLTRKIRPDGVAAILASCDRDTHAGRRDYALLMLLARLGLRAGKAAAIRTGDIDWRCGTILVRGKGGYDERLPPSARCRRRDRGLLPERPPAECRKRGAVPARPRPLRAGDAVDGRIRRDTRLPAGRAGADQRPPVPALRRDCDAAGRRAPIGGQPAAAPPAREHDIEVRDHRP